MQPRTLLRFAAPFLLAAVLSCGDDSGGKSTGSNNAGSDDNSDSSDNSDGSDNSDNSDSSDSSDDSAPPKDAGVKKDAGSTTSTNTGSKDAGSTGGSSTSDASVGTSKDGGSTGGSTGGNSSGNHDAGSAHTCAKNSDCPTTAGDGIGCCDVPTKTCYVSQQKTCPTSTGGTGQMMY